MESCDWPRAVPGYYRFLNLQMLKKHVLGFIEGSVSAGLPVGWRAHLFWIRFACQQPLGPSFDCVQAATGRVVLNSPFGP